MTRCAVLLLGLMVPDVKPGDGSVEQNESEPWGVEEIISSTRAMIPLIVALIILLKLVVRSASHGAFFFPNETFTILVQVPGPRDVRRAQGVSLQGHPVQSQHVNIPFSHASFSLHE